jgi:ABC-2 type transport system ATP-binding protein
MIDSKENCSNVLIKINKLSKSFKKIKVIDNLTTNFCSNERVALIGQNGAGKTTLIRCILGQYIYDGNLTVLGMDPRTDREEILKSVGFVPQLPPPLKMTVQEILDFFSGLTGTDSKEFISISEDLGLSIKNNLSKPFLKLSGGMKQKLLVSLALGRKPKIILMDEPSANLDPKAREIFFQYLNDVSKESLMILSSHRMNEISTLVTRVVEMDLGKITLDDHLIVSASTENKFNYEIVLKEINEDLTKILNDWHFTKQNGDLIWQSDISESDNVKFMNIISRFSGIILDIKMVKKES